jgi:amidase
MARGEAVGPLHGLPIAFKDLEPAVGFPCTFGSPIFKDLMPTEDSVQSNLVLVTDWAATLHK